MWGTCAQELQNMIDPILESDDKNNYPKFIAVQQADAASKTNTKSEQL